MTDLQNSTPLVWPTDITYKKSERTLFVTYDNGEKIALSAQLLRVESPSAEVQGHNPSQKITVTGKENVGIVAVEPTGNYAVRLVFDDGHGSGIYTWKYLYELAQKETGSVQGCGCGNKKGCGAA